MGISSSLLQKHVTVLLSRTFARMYQTFLEEKVYTLNKQYFGFAFNTIRFKYNTSNWGSCSAKKNLNFSTRLLFAPEDVINYVIIHELVHLKYLNHSSSFWSLVQAVMPDYKIKIKWLRKHGYSCDF